MTNKIEKSQNLTNWGTNLLNKLSAISRNKRKRDASKRRRKNDKEEVNKQINATDKS